jgi:phosphoribosylformimino-5-aminoimidazole carboxamide ribonucleotide (ProFAR) isomerase
VTSADDVRRLAELGLAGAIVGRSLYEGRVALSDLLAAACTAPAPAHGRIA